MKFIHTLSIYCTVILCGNFARWIDDHDAMELPTKECAGDSVSHSLISANGDILCIFDKSGYLVYNVFLQTNGLKCLISSADGTFYWDRTEKDEPHEQPFTTLNGLDPSANLHGYTIEFDDGVATITNEDMEVYMEVCVV